MSKKFWIPVFVALLLALAAGAWAYADAAAQGPVPRGRQRKLPGVLGQVTSVGADKFTIQARAGQERTFRYDETTRFIDPQKQQLSSEDLQTGGWVAVVVARRSGEPFLARAVVILPEGFDPAIWTVMRGQVMDLADLQAGMLAQARAEKQADGGLLAKTVRAHIPSDQRFLGKVTAIDGQTFTIQTRQGESITFQVTEETRFRSRKGVVEILADLKVGMPAGVGAKALGNGQYQALVLWVAPDRIK